MTCLKGIDGFGEARVSKYGSRLIDEINKKEMT